MARRYIEVIAAARPDMSAAIAERAYYKAERRGFAPGQEIEDWLAAEREVAALAAAPPVEPVPKKPAKRNNGTVKKLK
jgi:hypothetical protein